MRKYLTLTKCLLKESGAAMSFKMTGKKAGKGSFAVVLIWVLLLLCFVPMVAMFYLMFDILYNAFAPIGQLDYITGIAFNVVSLVIFIFAIFQTPSVFYLSRDINYLLPLPLSATQIIGAKFTVSLIYEYLVTVVFLGPMYAVYMKHTNILLFTVNGLPAMLTLPIIPLIYATVLVMLLMRFSNIGKNKDFINYAVGISAVLIGMAVSIFSRSLSNVGQDELMNALSNGAPLFNALAYIFPGVGFSAASVANGNLLYMFLNLAITSATMFAFLVLAKLLYFKGVIGITEAASPVKKLSRSDILMLVKGRSVFAAYLSKEIKLLLRSPVAFLNCIATVLFVPVLLIMSFVMQPEVMENLKKINYTDSRAAGVVFIIAIVTGILQTAICSVSATSISREGRNYVFMKYIPVDHKTQINAKVFSGILVTVSGIIIFITAAAFITRMPLWIFICAIVIMLPGVFFMNYAGILVDLIHPKLEWDDEQSAVKRNLNVILMMLVAFIISTAVAIAGFLLYNKSLPVYVVLFCVEVILTFAFYQLVMRMGERLINKM